MFWDMLSTFVKVAGSLTESNAGAAAADYNKKIGLFNQAVTIQQGDIAEAMQRRQAAGVIAQSVANAGGSGFSSTSGSPVDVFQSSAYNAEIDALNTRYNYRTKATAYGMDAQLQSQRAASIRQGGWLTASGILLTGYGEARKNDYYAGSRDASPFRLG